MNMFFYFLMFSAFVMTNCSSIDKIFDLFQHELHLNFLTRKSKQPPKQTKAIKKPTINITGTLCATFTPFMRECQGTVCLNMNRSHHRSSQTHAFIQ